MNPRSSSIYKLHILGMVLGRAETCCLDQRRLRLDALPLEQASSCAGLAAGIRIDSREVPVALSSCSSSSVEAVSLQVVKKEIQLFQLFNDPCKSAHEHEPKPKLHVVFLY